MFLDGGSVYPWLAALEILNKKCLGYFEARYVFNPLWLGQTGLGSMIKEGESEINKEGSWVNKECFLKWTHILSHKAASFFFFCISAVRVCACARVHLHVTAGHLYSGLQRLSPSAALIRDVIKSCVNWCWGQHWPPSSLRASIQFSFCIPLNGERTSIINLLYPGDKSSVKEPNKREKERALSISIKLIPALSVFKRWRVHSDRLKQPEEKSEKRWEDNLLNVSKVGLHKIWRNSPQRTAAQ